MCKITIMKSKIKYICPIITFLLICTSIDWSLNALIALVNGLGGGIVAAWILSERIDSHGK